MTEEVYRIEIPIHASDNTDPAISTAQKKVYGFEKSIERMEQKMNRVKQSKLEVVANAVDKASQVINRIESRVKSMSGRTYSIAIGVKDLVTRPLKSIAGFMTSTIGMLTAGAGIAGGIVIPMRISGDYEQTSIAFETMLKDGQRAKKFLEEASDFADKTPFEFPELINSTKLLIAFGFEAEKTLGIMKTVGDTSSGLGAGATGVERITRALGQMKAKGRLQAEELLQLQELGVPAAQILQEELGLTAEQVANIGREGVEAGRGIDALLRGMEKRFGGMMEKQSQSAMGLISTIKDTIQNKLLRRWGEGLWSGLKPQLSKIVDWLDRNKDQVKRWGEEFQKAGQNISRWITSNIEQVGKRISGLVNSADWKNATTIGEKIRLVWDKIISEPFEEWWNGTGKAKVTKVAEKMGRGLGGAIGGFIASALGIAADPDKAMQESPFLCAGTTAGTAFLNAFLEAFEADKIADKLIGAIKGVGKDAATLLPGGKEASPTSWISAALLTVLGLKTGKGIFKAAKGGKSLWKGAKNLTGMFKGGAKGAAAAADTVADTAKAADNVADAVADTAKPGMLDRVKGIFKGSKKGVEAAAQNTSGPYSFASNRPGYTAADAKWWEKADLDSAFKRDDIVKLANEGKLGKYDDMLSAFGGPKKPGILAKTGEYLKKLNPLKMLDKGSDAAKAIGKSGKAVGFLGKAGKGLKGIPVAGALLSLLSSGAVVAAASPEEREKEIWGEVGGTLGGVAGGAAGGAAAGAAIGALFGGVGAVPGAAIGGIVGGIGGAIGGEAFTEWLYDQKDSIASWASDVGKTFSDAWQGVKNGASDAGTWVAGKWEEAKSSVQDKWSAVSGWFDENVGTPVKNGFINTVNFSVGLFDIGREKAQEAWAPVGAWLDENVWTPVKGAAESAANWAGQKWDEAKAWTQETWSSFTGWCDENIWTPVKGAAETAAAWTGQKWDEAKAWTQETWSSFSGWFDESVWSPVKGAAESAAGWAGQKWDEAKGVMQEAWGSVTGWFDENIWSPLKSAGESAASWIGQKFGEAKSWAQDVWGGFTGWFNDKIAKPVSDFASGTAERGSKITGLTPEKHAEGGILSRPHMGLVAEAGPEAIIPLSTTRRNRGVSLWEQVGRIFGISAMDKPFKAYSEGGMAGNLSGLLEPNAPVAIPKEAKPVVPPSTGNGGSNPSIHLTVQANPTYKIESASSEADIFRIIRENNVELADELLETITKILPAIMKNIVIVPGGA